MLRCLRWAVPALCVLAPLTARAQNCGAPVVAAPPAVSYYAAPAPVVSYYAPATSYYVPTTSYYAPAPVSVSTYRYGLFGRRSLTTVNYGAPAYYAPAPATVSSYYYSPPVIAQPSYYVPAYQVP